MASEIRDIEQKALTMTHLMLGMLLVPGSHLTMCCRAALGDGVNLPLLLLRLGRNRVSQAAARLVADLGDRTGPGTVHAVADLPPCELRALVLDLHDVEDPDFDAAARVAACAPAGGPSFAGTDEERREPSHVLPGSVISDPCAIICFATRRRPAQRLPQRLLAAAYDPSEARSLLDTLDAHRYTDGGIEPVVAPPGSRRWDALRRHRLVALGAGRSHRRYSGGTHLAGSAVGGARCRPRRPTAPDGDVDSPPSPRRRAGAACCPGRQYRARRSQPRARAD